MANKDRVRLLVEALRSGDYEQAFGELGVVHGDLQKNCCLGVACEVAKANGLDIEVAIDEDYGTTIYYDNESGTLPASVADWYGFEDSDPFLKLTQEDIQYIIANNPSLSTLVDGTSYYSPRTNFGATTFNDSLNKDFSTIADRFESTFLGDEE